MKHTYHIKMRAVLWVMLSVACFASASAMAWDQNPTGKCMNCDGSESGSSGGSSTPSYNSSPSYDYGAAQRAQEAEAAAAAERQRQQAEAERIERERVRQAEEKRKKEEAEFIRGRDSAAGTLKGSSPAMNQLKGIAGADNSGLKGSGFDSGDTGLKGLHGSSSVVDDRNEPAGLGGKSNFKGAIAKPNKPAPHTDTSVVDARNVPSGLPKSVDDAIPHTPSGDRVRKGFQAIQAGDWKAALAWFQDARNKEPSNHGLGRLVDLAKFTLEYRAQTPAVEKNSTPVQSTQLPKQNTTINSTGGAVAKSGDPAVEPGEGSLARAAAGQMAARARADAAFKQYVKKYGDHYSDARTRAVSKAYRGEGYTDEELKAQLQKSLLDYRKNYRKNHPNGSDDSVGGSPAAEEIILGGKG